MIEVMSFRRDSAVEMVPREKTSEKMLAFLYSVLYSQDTKWE